ncbi:MAG: TolC family protein [Tannerellaceae bacterium]|nr:TolC family protein [Tannerellaceae bacterium]
MKRLLIYALIIGLPAGAYAQDTLRITLHEAICLARQNSSDAISARHAFRAAYWDYRTYKANLLPSITLTADPQLNRSINSITLEDGSDVYVHRNQLSTNAAITINQNIPLTGGSLYAYTSLNRIDLFNDNTYSYMSQPLVVGYSQNLFGYNSLKWSKKIEPMRYKEARKALVESMEVVAVQATYKFFQLALAQSSCEIARYNYAQADTLFQYAQGRYNIGTINENEMLQLEINLLTQQTNIMNAEIQVDNCIEDLRHYLGLNEGVELIVEVNDVVPSLFIPIGQALAMAYENNPEIDNMEHTRIVSKSNVAYARSLRGFSSSLYMEFGLTQTDRKLGHAYRNPVDQQAVSVGIRIPVLDWGVGKGRVKVALSERDKVYTQLEQQKINFTTNVINTVKQFNLQNNKVSIATKTDQAAVKRNEIAHKLYLLGKSTVLDLNAAVAEKDNARYNYLSTLYDYWSLYYSIRRITGYDFERGRELGVDYELLMK